MPLIVAVGFQGGPADGDTEVASLPTPLTKEGVGFLVDLVGSGIEREGHVVLLAPSWSDRATLERVDTLRSILAGNRLVIRPTDLPPLAGAVFASVASGLCRYIASPGLLLAALDRLQRELVVMAWLGTVSGLRTPRPNLPQRMASMWPPSAFAVSLSPTPQIRRVTRHGPGLPLSPPPHPVRLAVAAGEGDPSWVRDVVAPALGQPTVDELPPTPLGPAWWGSRKLVEAVAYPADLPVAATRLTSAVEGRLCWWCEETVASDPCPFCGLDATAPRAGAPA